MRQASGVAKMTAVVAASWLVSCATVPSVKADPDGVEALVAFDARAERGSTVSGIADPGTGRLATIDDPVRIASISKLVVAIGVLKLVDQGRLELDRNVGEVLGWPLRNPTHPDEAITLRMLLSHTSSIRDHDDQYAIPLGGSLRQVMADPRSWDMRRGPDDRYFTYANMNTPVVASVMELVTGERFDRWMRREVLEPMKLDACFNWPTCSDAAVRRAIVLTSNGKPIRDDLRGRQPDCPVFVRDGAACDLSRWRPGENGALFSPQGGLRISARDLARLGRMLLNVGELDGVRIISHRSWSELMRTSAIVEGVSGRTDDGFICSYGLSTHRLAAGRTGCRDDPARDGVRRIGHAGEAYGVRSGLWIDPERGTGIAYLRTGLPPLPPAGRSAFRAVEEDMFRRALVLGERAPIPPAAYKAHR